MESTIVKTKFGGKFRVFRDNDNIQVVETGYIMTIDQVEDKLVKTKNMSTAIMLETWIDAFIEGKRKWFQEVTDNGLLQI